jgi:hypothetical protein
VLLVEALERMESWYFAVEHCLDLQLRMEQPVAVVFVVVLLLTVVAAAVHVADAHPLVVVVAEA